MLLAGSKAAPCGPDPALPELAWLIRLRGWAAAGVAATSTAAASLGVVPSALPFLLVAAALATCDGVVLLWLRHHPAPAPAAVGRALFLQLLLDVLALAVLLHLAGGAENPFFSVFALLMAVGAMLLDRASAWALAAVAVTLHGGLALGEHLGLLAHHPITVFSGHPLTSAVHRDPAFVVGYLLAFTLMVGGVVAFVQALAQRQWRAEAEQRRHERVAREHERLARVGELAAGVAHAVRNPLHGLITCVDILRHDGDGPPDAELLALMGEGVERIDRVTRDLCELADLTPPDLQATSPRQVVEEALRDVSEHARARRVRVTSRLTDCAPIPLDRRRLGEALRDVLDGALAASPCNDQILVALNEVDAGEGVCVEVADHGAGIAARDLPHVFEPFYRARAGAEEHGLGLAYARHVMEQHQGRIEIDSRRGEGTRVRLILPTAPGAAVEGGAA